MFPMEIPFRHAGKPVFTDGSGHQKQYERIICASNAVICISGDVRKEEVLPLLEKHLGGMRAGTPPALTPTPALRAGREVAVLDKQQ